MPSCHTRLSAEPLSVDAALAFVRSPACGAVSTFLGTTRDTFEGKTVTRLAYEAYEKMCSPVLQDMAEEVWREMGVERVWLQHRTGEVSQGEISIVVAVSAAHRREAIDACAFLVDKVKAEAPIWKLEEYATGPPAWKENREWAALGS